MFAVGNVESVLNAKILANHFKKLCKEYNQTFMKASTWIDHQKAVVSEKLLFFLTQVRRLIFEHKIDGEIFKDEFKKIHDINILSIDILWYLQFSKLLNLIEYIQFHEHSKNEYIIEHISSQVFRKLLEYKPNLSKIKTVMLTDVIKTVFECSKKNTLNRNNSYYENVMNGITTNLKRLYNYEINCDDERYIELSHLVEIFYNLESYKDAILRFFQHLITALLESSKPVTESIFKKQDKIKNTVKNEKIYQFFVVISKFLDLDFLLKELEVKLMNTSVNINWDQMLCFITFIGVSYKDGWSKLKALSDFMLKTSFQNLDKKLLSQVFLIARQACFEKLNSCFPSYLQWFSSTFSFDSRRPLNSKKVCVFFFDFLTELIPYDSAHYLKVHINRVPCVPAHCHSISNDYVALVKRQLEDLNVSVELGIFENSTHKSASAFDVENVMMHFQRTNDILSSLFHASMFCKDYYEKKFLVELLKKFEGKKSVRHRLILKLHSLGRIPNSMFKVYKALEKK